jgi:NAD-dependent dihydropyrimidine dehydrogenase PreA subunit
MIYVIFALPEKTLASTEITSTIAIIRNTSRISILLQLTYKYLLQYFIYYNAMWETQMKIARYRVIVQILAFLILAYGGLYITVKHIDSFVMPFIVPPDGPVKQPHLEPKTQYDTVFDTYFPSRTCRYVSTETRVFRACSMHFFTEVPIYGVPLLDFMPHLILFVVLGFLLARVLCGWICPLGAIQDFLNWLRIKLGLKRLRLPRLFLVFFERFRYVWLAALFIMAIAIVIPLLGLVPFQQQLNIIGCNTCPGRTIFPLLTLSMPGGWVFDSPINLVLSVLGILFMLSFFLSFFGKRLWCKLCPTGALLSIFNKGGAVIKEKDVRICTKCGICERSCPMDQKKVFEEKKKKIVNSYSCINCFRCVDECPEDNALKVKFFKWTIFRSKYDKKDKGNL